MDFAILLATNHALEFQIMGGFPIEIETKISKPVTNSLAIFLI